jgi:dolichol-phosphate mannosyltransferase
LNNDTTLVIIPTYNERENAPEIIRAVFAVVPEAHFLLVDDNSPDGTAELATEQFGDNPKFHLLKRTKDRGLGRSYVDGYRWALDRGYARVVQMDADFSHDPKSIPDLLRAAQDADVVLGSRYCRGGGVRNWPLKRRLLSRYANLYVRLITGVPVFDSTSGFRCHTYQALKRMAVEEIVSNGYAFQVEMTYRALKAGLRIAETPIIFTDRTLGQSKMSGGVIWESIGMPWKLRLGRTKTKEKADKVTR